MACLGVLVLAVVLWWLFRSNQHRGTALETWAHARGWTYSVDSDDLRGVLTAEAFVPRTVWAREVTDAYADRDRHLVRGAVDGREAFGWEHFHSTGVGGQRRPGTVQVVAVRLRSTVPAFQLTPSSPGIALMAGPSHLPDVVGDAVPSTWNASGDPSHLGAIGPLLADGPPWPDLLAVRVESGVAAAWFRGQSVPDRIEPVARWLASLADRIDAPPR